MSSSLQPDVVAGQAIYGPLVLALYDQLVLGLSSSVFWGCSKQRMQTHYDRHLATTHCVIGVGTGCLLEDGRFPDPEPSITLVDLNENSLSKAAKRIERYAPRQVRANVLEPLPLPEGTFGSVGMNHLLHCVPGAIAQKGRTVFGHVRRLLRPGGVVFGSTILSQGIRMGPHTRALMAAYNRKGIFHNAEDSLDGLRGALADSFTSYELKVCGVVALFAGR